MSFAQYTVGDFDNDGKEELMFFNPYSKNKAEILHYLPSISGAPPTWRHSNTLLNGISNWQNDLFISVQIIQTQPPAMILVPVLAGNIDYDGKDEFMYVALNGNSKTAEYIDDNTCIANWDNSTNFPYIDDWNVLDYHYDRYMLIKPEKYMPEYLLGIRGRNDRCEPFLVNMYRSMDKTDKKVAISTIRDSIMTLPAVDINRINDHINIFPNPTSGMFTLVTGTISNFGEVGNKDYDVYVYNNMGKEVYSKHSISSLITEVAINLESQSKGVYLVRIVKNTGESKTRKVIIN